MSSRLSEDCGLVTANHGVEDENGAWSGSRWRHGCNVEGDYGAILAKNRKSKKNVGPKRKKRTENPIEQKTRPKKKRKIEYEDGLKKRRCYVGEKVLAPRQEANKIDRGTILHADAKAGKNSIRFYDDDGQEEANVKVYLMRLFYERMCSHHCNFKFTKKMLVYFMLCWASLSREDGRLSVVF